MSRSLLSWGSSTKPPGRSSTRPSLPLVGDESGDRDIFVSASTTYQRDPRHNSGHGAGRPEPGLKCLFEMERTGIEPVASDLQIPGFSVELGQVGSTTAKLRRQRAIE